MEGLKNLCTDVAKTKALISCPVTTQLICAFIFPFAERRFSHEQQSSYNLDPTFISIEKLMWALEYKAMDRIAQKLLCFTHDLDTKHQR